MATDPAVERLIVSYADLTLNVRRQVLAFIQRAWGSLSSWRDADIERFVAAVVPIVNGGQIQIAALTDGYLAAVEAAMTGLPARPVGIPATFVTDEAVRGVATADVYRRTGPTVWTALSKGSTLEVAAGLGLSRALALGATDMQLAKTHASRHVLATKSKVTGYRRVLAGGDVCSLCRVAARRPYGKADLLPLHPGCSCSVVPIYGRKDPDPDEPEINEDDRGTPVVRRHGELGPVLAVKGQSFRSPEDLP